MPPSVPTILERAELFAALAWRLGKPYPAAALDVLRQRLLQNAPSEALEMCGQIAQDSLDAIADQIDTTAPLSPSTTDPARPVKPLAPDPLLTVLVFNPLGWPRTEEAALSFSLPAGMTPTGTIAVRGAQADAAPCTVTREPDPADPAAVRWTVRFPAAVPAFGYQTYFLTPEQPVAFPPAVLPAQSRLEAEGEWAAVREQQDAESASQPLLTTRTGLHAGPLPKAHAFFRFEPEALFLSAVRRSEDGQALLFSAVNRGTSPVRPVLALSEPLHLGKPVWVSPAEDVDILPPRQTVTWRCEAKGQPA